MIMVTRFIVKMKNGMYEENGGTKCRLMNEECVKQMIVNSGKEMRNDCFCVSFFKRKKLIGKEIEKYFDVGLEISCTRGFHSQHSQ